MRYRTDERSGNQLSSLGFGCMRFPRGIGGIDLKKSEQLILRAVQAGVNYFDTAYLYGGSEAALGAILKNNGIRDRVYLATKLPIGSCHTKDDFDRFFERQCSSLQTDWIDYYLMHNIHTLEQWRELCALGIEDWIARQKAEGKIKQAGFSFHGTKDEFLKLLDAYDWDFCQIQYNYSDENYQAGVTGLRKAAAKQIPVVVMEPLLGGKLASGLPPKAVEVFCGVNPSLTPAAWGLRWLWDQPEVTVVLSGMSGAAQLEENLKTAELSLPGALTGEEKKAYARAIEIFQASYKVPCTGCEYCMPCPQNVNIPGCFAAYNTSYAFGRIPGFVQYATSGDFMAGKCVGCGKCERHCPQNIGIRSALGDVRRRMEPFYFRWGMALMRRWTK